MKQYQIFVDANVLIGAACFRKRILKTDTDNRALSYILKRKDVSLYTSSFSIPQMVSTLSNAKRTGKKIFTAEEVISEVESILKHFSLVNFDKSDIHKSIVNFTTKGQTSDLEDQMQFDLSRKVGCNFIMTNNLKDFRSFTDVYVFPPKKYSSVIV